MDNPFLMLLIVFGVGLLLGRKHPVVLVAGVFLVIGLSVYGTGFGDLVGTLLSGAYGLIS